MSLIGTTWTAELEGAGTQTWEFNTDGTVNITFPNGQVGTGYLTEGGVEAFMIQQPNSTTNKNIQCDMFGSYNNGTGKGYWVNYTGDGNKSTLLPLTMTKK